jgi:hypothetical protein
MPWMLCLVWAATSSAQAAFRQVLYIVVPSTLASFRVQTNGVHCYILRSAACSWVVVELGRGAPFEWSINIALVILLVWFVGIVSVLWLPKFMLCNQYSSFLVGPGVVRYVTLLWAGTTFTHCWEMDWNGNRLTQSPIAKILHIEFQN